MKVMRFDLRAACGAAIALCFIGRVLAQSSYEAPPFDSVHLNVPEISSARDWYLKNIGGNAGETADRVAFGRWSGDHPLPLQIIFEMSSDTKPSAGTAIDSVGFSYRDLDA